MKCMMRQLTMPVGHWAVQQMCGSTIRISVAPCCINTRTRSNTVRGVFLPMKLSYHLPYKSLWVITCWRLSMKLVLRWTFLISKRSFFHNKKFCALRKIQFEKTEQLICFPSSCAAEDLQQVLDVYLFQSNHVVKNSTYLWHRVLSDVYSIRNDTDSYILM